jgi:hypothetical protein
LDPFQSSPEKGLSEKQGLKKYVQKQQLFPTAKR